MYSIFLLDYEETYTYKGHVFSVDQYYYTIDGSKSVLVSKDIVYSPRMSSLNYTVLNPIMTKEKNKAGSLEFTIPITNPMYNSFKKLRSIVTVEKDGREIWRGRVLDTTRDFYNNKKVVCEGELSFLNDVDIRFPKTYATNGVSPTDFIEYVLSEYNNPRSGCSSYRRIINSNNHQIDPDGAQKIYVSRDGSVYSSTSIDKSSQDINFTTPYNALLDILIGTIGGFIYLERGVDPQNGEEITTLTFSNVDINSSELRSSQTIEFRKNMLDIEEYIDSSEVFTRIYPIGRKDSDGKVTFLYPYWENTRFHDKNVDSFVDWYKETYKPDFDVPYYNNINDTLRSLLFWFEDFPYDYLDYGSSKYGEFVFDKDNKKIGKFGFNIDGKNGFVTIKKGVDLFGIISKVVEFEDVSEPVPLRHRAEEALIKALESAVTIEISAVDLSVIDVNVNEFELCKSVRVKSEPHDIDSWFQLTKITLDLVNPENSEYVFGTTYKMLTDQIARNSSSTAEIETAMFISNSQMLNRISNLEK